MSTTRNAHLRTKRRSPKIRGSLRTVSKRASNRSERQKNFRYHHYA